ncbi:ATP-binding protein [Chakrabartyella piscis]|uniref:ATP-binding protein n=1 Tax=Chakrabartyella piscis TaxID=2918914 RepID=UPI002958D703|nr:ATP-binding protein [Chakrabartyella piscis]
MAITTKDGILKVLRSFNPWWVSGNISESFSRKYKRFAYYEAMKRVNETEIRRTVVLTGTRRVGKTTIQYQMIEELLSSGVSPQKIVFISLDHPMLKLAGMNDVLECYHENIYPDQDVYYFFDEIQYATDWAQWLKTIYDTQPTTKVVATGSASPALVRGSTESGAGRWTVIQVPTLSFYEYCALIGLPDLELSPTLKPSQLLKLTQQERGQIMNKLTAVQNHFIRYLQVGGFPELALAKNDLLAEQVMREDVVDKVLKRDLPALYNIRNATELERIFLYLCNVSSEIVAIDAMAKELNGVSRQTVQNYVEYLESANLIYLSYPLNLDGKKVLKARPKIYIADAAIRNAVLMDSEVLSNPVEMGKIVETAVYKHIAAFYYQQAGQVGYFRGSKKNKEIDIVVEYPKIKNILIEVKYREQASIPNDDAIAEFCKDSSSAIIVTKRVDDFGEHTTGDGNVMLRIPAFAFLYLLGHAEKNGYKGMN